MSPFRSDSPAVNEPGTPRGSLPAVVARVVGICGFLAVAVSPFLPWFSVPTIGEAAGQAAVIAHESPASWAFRGLCLAAVVVSIGCYRRSRGWRRACGWSFLILSVLLLFFPYCISVWSPTIAGEASWFYSQHESLMAGAGDIYNAQEYKDRFWRQRVFLVTRPLGSEIHSLPDWGPANFGWTRLIEVVEWFGLTAWFSFFLGKGWVLAVLGAPAVLGALARESWGRDAGVQFVRRGSLLFALACGCALIPPCVGNWLMKASRQAAQQGRYEHARNSLHAASSWMPSVREDGNFVLEMGLLENALGLETAAARHYRARVLEKDGFELQARSAYVEGLSGLDGSPALTRDCAEALLRLGAKALNSGEVNGAIEMLEIVMAFDPCNLRANYALQLAFLHQGDREALVRLQARMTDTYRHLNAPTKAAVLAHGSENLAFNEYLHGDLTAALEAWKGARRH